MKTLVSMLLLVGMAQAADSPDAIRAEKRQLQGTWVVESAKLEKEVVEGFVGATFEFSGDKLTTKMGKVGAIASYTINPAKSSKWLDIVVERQDGTKTIMKAIYELDGDKLTIRQGVGSTTATKTKDNNGKVEEKVVEKEPERPAKMDSGSGMVMTLKRQKK